LYFHSRRIGVGEYFLIKDYQDSNASCGTFVQLLGIYDVPLVQFYKVVLVQVFTSNERDSGLDCPLLSPSSQRFMSMADFHISRLVMVLSHPSSGDDKLLVYNKYIKKEIGDKADFDNEEEVENQINDTELDVEDDMEKDDTEHDIEDDDMENDDTEDDDIENDIDDDIENDMEDEEIDM